MSTYTLPTLHEHLETATESKNNYAEPQEKYVFRIVQNLVDDVCLFYGKKEAVLKKYDGKQEPENMKLELDNIPVRAVPLVLNPDDPKYRALIRAPVENEKGTPAGYFGW
jgi:hypothetical protein